MYDYSLDLAWSGSKISGSAYFYYAGKMKLNGSPILMFDDKIL